MALPLLILILQFSGLFGFTMLISLVAAAGLHEFYQMTLPGQRCAERGLAIAFGTFLVPLCVRFGMQVLFPGLTLALLGFGLIFLWRHGDLQRVIVQLALLFFGFVYIALTLSHLVLLRSLPSGLQWIYLVLLIVMVSDSAAYFTGINLGRRKLYPAISPNKSVEGAIGGLAGGLLAAFVSRYTFFPALSILDCLFLGVGLGVLSQLGDLFESMLKRACTVKDSGSLLPGHGGILDRLDSLLFAFPLAYYYGRYFLG